MESIIPGRWLSKERTHTLGGKFVLCSREGGITADHVSKRGRKEDSLSTCGVEREALYSPLSFDAPFDWFLGCFSFFLNDENQVRNVRVFVRILWLALNCPRLDLALSCVFGLGSSFPFQKSCVPEG